METKLYRNNDGEENPFLVFHISDAFQFESLEKFVGGDVGNANGKLVVATVQGPRSFEVGDFVVHVTNSSPFSRVRLTIDKVRHSVPKNSFMFCKPDEFNRNFTEVNSGRPVGASVPTT